MKIIKRGTPPSEKRYEGICPKCHSQLEATGAEVEYKSDCRNDGWYEAKCPVCDATFYPRPL